jgi:hypothetical protein
MGRAQHWAGLVLQFVCAKTCNSLGINRVQARLLLLLLLLLLPLILPVGCRTESVTHCPGYCLRK